MKPRRKSKKPRNAWRKPPLMLQDSRRRTCSVTMDHKVTFRCAFKVAFPEMLVHNCCWRFFFHTELRLILSCCQYVGDAIVVLCFASFVFICVCDSQVSNSRVCVTNHVFRFASKLFASWCQEESSYPMEERVSSQARDC